MDNRKIVFYDGDCGFCNRTIMFLIKNEIDEDIKFASNNSVIAQKMLSGADIQNVKNDTIIFCKNQRIFTKSTAILELMGEMNSKARMLSIFIWIPSFIRNFIYDIISKMRHKIYPKKSCSILSEKEKKYFIS